MKHPRISRAQGNEWSIFRHHKLLKRKCPPSLPPPFPGYIVYNNDACLGKDARPVHLDVMHNGPDGAEALT